MYQFRSVVADRSATGSASRSRRRLFAAGLIPATLVFLGGGLWVAQLADWVGANVFSTAPPLMQLALASYGVGILLSCVNLWLLLGARSAEAAVRPLPLQQIAGEVVTPGALTTMAVADVETLREIGFRPDAAASGAESRAATGMQDVQEHLPARGPSVQVPG